jgi:adenylosuccinate lyase
VALSRRAGFEKRQIVSGQTYSRKQDDFVVRALSGLAQSAHKIGTDLRLLQHDGELEEPFEAEQVGSSAMPYKRNPMRAERICALARHVVALSLDTAMTAATQWLERSLDDSANKRIAVPEAFLAADAILVLLENVVGGLVVHPEVSRRRLAEQLPYLATEELLMEAVRRGGDRQELHERLRVHARASADRAAREGGAPDLFERLAADPTFALRREEIEAAALPEKLVGRCPEQVEQFVREELDPALAGVETIASAPVRV